MVVNPNEFRVVCDRTQQCFIVPNETLPGLGDGGASESLFILDPAAYDSDAGRSNLSYFNDPSDLILNAGSYGDFGISVLDAEVEPQPIVDPSVFDELATNMTLQRERNAEILSHVTEWTASSMTAEERRAWHEQTEGAYYASQVENLTIDFEPGVSYSLATEFDRLPDPIRESMEGYVQSDRDHDRDDEIFFTVENREVQGAMIPLIFFFRRSSLMNSLFGEPPAAGPSSPPSILTSRGMTRSTATPRPPSNPSAISGVFQIGGVVAIVAALDYSVIALDLPEEARMPVVSGGSLLLYEGASRYGLMPRAHWGTALRGMPVFYAMNMGFAYGLDEMGIPMDSNWNRYGSLGLSAYGYARVIPAFAAEYPGFHAAFNSSLGLSTTRIPNAVAGTSAMYEALPARWSVNFGRFGSIFVAEGWTGLGARSLPVRIAGGGLQVLNGAFAVFVGDALGGVLVNAIIPDLDDSPHGRLFVAAYNSILDEDYGVATGFFGNLIKGIQAIPTYVSDTCEEALFGEHGVIRMRENEWIRNSENFSNFVDSNLVQVSMRSVRMRDGQPQFVWNEFTQGLRGLYRQVGSEDRGNYYDLMNLTQHRSDIVETIYDGLNRDGSIDDVSVLLEQLETNVSTNLRRAGQRFDERRLELDLAREVDGRLVERSFRPIMNEGQIEGAVFVDTGERLNREQITFLIGAGDGSEGQRLHDELVVLQTVQSQARDAGIEH